MTELSSRMDRFTLTTPRERWWIIGTVAAVFLALMLMMAGCASDDAKNAPLAPVAAQPMAQPVIVQQSPPPNNDGFWTGFLAAHFMMHSMSAPVYHPAYHAAPVVHQTTIVNKTVVRPAVRYVAPAPTRTYAPTIRSTPTFRAPTYRPSFSSSGRSFGGRHR